VLSVPIEYSFSTLPGNYQIYYHYSSQQARSDMIGTFSSRKHIISVNKLNFTKAETKRMLLSCLSSTRTVRHGWREGSSEEGTA